MKEIWDEAPIKRSAAEWALRWVWNHPEVTVVLSGMNEEKHVQENLRIAEQAYPNSLTEAELQLIKKVESKYRELMKVGCTGCQYCMPCPAGVNIPLCFEEYNNLHLVDNPDEERFMYAARLGGLSLSWRTRVCIPVRTVWSSALRNVPSTLTYLQFSNQLWKNLKDLT